MAKKPSPTLTPEETATTPADGQSTVTETLPPKPETETDEQSEAQAPAAAEASAAEHAETIPSRSPAYGDLVDADGNIVTVTEADVLAIVIITRDGRKLRAVMA